MKIRTGFVSNSSSSSFMVPLDDLTLDQEYCIRNHILVGKEMELSGCYCDEFDSWYIHKENGFLKGLTIMDNFDMRAFLEAIGVNDVQWD